MIDNMLKSQLTTLYEDATPTRFWNFVQTFDLNESHLKVHCLKVSVVFNFLNSQMLDDYLSGNIPFRQVGNNKFGGQTSKNEFKDLFDAALKNQVGSNAKNIKKPDKYEKQIKK